MMSQQITDLLKKAKCHISPDDICCPKKVEEYIDQALALSKQQPASDFSEKTREEFGGHTNWPDWAIHKRLMEACAIIDTSEASRKDLRAALENARVSIKIMSLPRLDESAASNDDILKVMDASFEAAIAKDKRESA